MYFRALLVFAGASIVLLFSSCDGEHQRFCSTSAKMLCEKCLSCGADGLRHCGLMKAKTKAECESQLLSVCHANDGVFNMELSRTCLDRISRVDCAHLRKEGKPDVCNRLF